MHVGFQAKHGPWARLKDDSRQASPRSVSSLPRSEAGRASAPGRRAARIPRSALRRGDAGDGRRHYVRPLHRRAEQLLGFAAAIAVSQNPPAKVYNPLISSTVRRPRARRTFCSPSGQTIRHNNNSARRSPTSRSEEFVNRDGQIHRHGHGGNFRQKYPQCRPLLAGRYPVHRRQGQHAGGVFSTPSTAWYEGRKADRRDLRPAAEGDEAPQRPPVLPRSRAACSRTCSRRIR